MKIDALISNNLADIIGQLNSLEIPKENVVTIFQNEAKEYVAIFYS